MHYFQFNIGDYMKHTARLSLMEDLAYRRMLDLYYLNDGPLCSDVKRLAKQIGMVGQEAEIEFVLSEFFTLDGDTYRNSRADKEISSYAEKAEKSRVNGRRGGRPRTKLEPSGNPEETQQVISGNPEETQVEPDGKLTINHKPLTINQEPDLKDKDLVADAPKNPADQLDWSSLLLSDEQIKDVKAIRAKHGKKGKISQRVINTLAVDFAELRTFGFTDDRIISEWDTRGWVTVKASWLIREANEAARFVSQQQRQQQRQMPTHTIGGINYGEDMDL